MQRLFSFDCELFHLPLFHLLYSGKILVYLRYDSLAKPMKTPSILKITKVFILLVALGGACSPLLEAQQKPVSPEPATGCRVEPVNYLGWDAQQVSNPLIKLIFVPQNGGRLMQVIFDGHSYLFVNPEYAGKTLPPSDTQWFNYGGDKIWVLPEGNDDEQHWVGNSDILDDGRFSFETVSAGPQCEVVLKGPADPKTGLQFTRTVRIEANSPRIQFHTVFQNSSGHAIEWSVQSVSQYNTGDANNPTKHNQTIWGFTKADPSSSYLNQYHVKFGPAENSAAKIRENGLFAIHYVPLAAELWIDSKAGWLAVVDGATQYAMVERFRYDETKPYPGKASVIFWTNGPSLRQSPDGTVTFGRPDKESSPFYMEAELNSPLVKLYPGESHSFDTEWLPTRSDTQFQGVTDPGVILKPLRAVEGSTGKISLTGSFGVFFSGKLVAHLYSSHGSNMSTQPVLDVDPRKICSLDFSFDASSKPGRISLHLVDSDGSDRGSLGEVIVERPAGNP